ncbi:MAG: phage tail sheath C-terminal domain-containing protein [Thermodesulfovibrionales bacterium]|nr:phage tail sheath C-terminal domain-containing protein [Thermodesulfovibrionales bacterium]
MSIQFSGIPSSIRKPGKYFEFNTALAVRTLPANKQKLLIVGQKTSSGTVAQKVPTKVFSDKTAETYFGAGSLCHLMARAAIKSNPYLDLTVIGLDDAGAGVAATGTVTFTGPATSAGVLTLYIGNQKVEIAIAKDDTATVIGAALVAQIAKQPDLPVTSAAALGVVTLTAKNKGICGNQIGLGYDLTNAAGVTVAIVAMASGATNPTLQDALTVVFAGDYNIVVTPFNNQTDLGTLKTHLDSVSGPMEQRPGIGVYGMNGALADATTLAGQVNSGRMLGAYVRCTSATKRRSMPYEIASAKAALLAYEEDPARPLNGLELSSIAVPDISDRLSRTEQETCLSNGVAPLEVGPGEKVQVVRAISTYLKDAQGVDDISLFDITTIRTLDYLRKACRERVALRFPREKLSSKTPPKVRAELLDVLMKLEELEIVEEVAANKAGLIVERSVQDPNRLDAQIPSDIVNGLHVLAARIELYL